MQKKKQINLLKSQIVDDWILVKPIVITESSSGGVKVHRPQQYDDKPEYGEIVAIGSGRLMENGEVIPLGVKVGQTILFQKYSFEKVRNPETGEDLLLVKREDIRAIV